MLHFWYALLGIMVVFLFWKWRRPKTFPPGPSALPIIGNLVELDFSNPLPNLKKLAEKYGNVYSLFLGGDLVVFLNGFQTVKEALVNNADAFSDRPHDPLFIKTSKMKCIITAPYGPSWKEHRRFTLMLLRNFGLGKKSMEARIMNEAKCLVKYFREIDGYAFNPKPVIHNAVCSVICSLLFNERFYDRQKAFGKMTKLIEENVKLSASFWGQVYNAIPFVRELPLPFQQLFENAKKIQRILNKIIMEHKNTLTPGKCRDFIDCYLEEMEKRKHEGNLSSFSEENLLFLMGDLFAAGNETTATTLMWALLLMMTYPDIQARCHKEIDSKLAYKEDLCYEDRLNLPYTLAVIHEIQRFMTALPLGVPHALSKETKFCGYTIPKGTKVITDLTSVLHDKSQWKYPDEFNPANFLNDNGEFEKNEAFLPFSAGPRVCLGENLARMEIFLFFTTILMNFEVYCPEASTVPNLTPVFGIAQTPLPFKIGLKNRNIVKNKDGMKI